MESMSRLVRFFAARNGVEVPQRVVVINQHSGYLMIDVLNALVEKHSVVSLITGQLVVRSTPLNPKVRLHRVMKYNRQTKIHRMLTWSTSFFQILFIVLTRCRGAHLLIVTNPPLNTFLPLFCRNPFSLLIFDVYPDVFSRTRMFRDDNVLIEHWKRINTRVFGRARHIFTLSESMAMLLKKYSGQKEVNVVSLWGDSSFSNLVARAHNPLVAELGLIDAFVVFYSGNLGSTHDVGVLALLAESLQARSDIKLLVVGDGEGRELLKKELAQRRLQNCVLLPLQALDKIPYTFGAADLAVASQAAGLGGISIPSKVFSYLTAGLPLLCVGSLDSDLAQLTRRYHPGRCFEPGDIVGMRTYVEELADNKAVHKAYKDNALVAAREFTAQNADKIAERLLSPLSLES